MLAPEPESTDPVNGTVKPERAVVVQEIQDAASEAEDGQEHEDGADDAAAVRTDDEESDGTCCYARVSVVIAEGRRFLRGCSVGY